MVFAIYEDSITGENQHGNNILARNIRYTRYHSTGEGRSDRQRTVEGEARKAFAGGARDMVLDLSHTPYISSAGLRAIHTIYMLLRSADPVDESSAVRDIARGTYKSPHLKLVKPSKNGLKALTTAGYDIFLELHNSLPEAVASFG